MSQYLISSTGHNVAIGDLDPIVPQPRSEGLQATQRSYSANGGIYQSGLYTELQWSALGTVALYAALLAQFGLTTALSAEVTVQVRDQNFAWIRMNGTAVRPEQGKDIRRDILLKGVVILIRDCEVAL